MGAGLGAIKIFWKEAEVTVVQHCDYTKCN